MSGSCVLLIFFHGLLGNTASILVFWKQHGETSRDLIDRKQEKESVVVSMHNLSTLLERNVTRFLSTGPRENIGTDAMLHVIWSNQSGHRQQVCIVYTRTLISFLLLSKQWALTAFAWN